MCLGYIGLREAESANVNDTVCERWVRSFDEVQARDNAPTFRIVGVLGLNSINGPKEGLAMRLYLQGLRVADLICNSQCVKGERKMLRMASKQNCLVLGLW